MFETEKELLERIATLKWLGVKSMPVQANRSVLLDVVFTTAQGAICLTGQAHPVGDGDEEVFSLLIHEHDEEKWWKEGGPNAVEWEPRFIDAELQNKSFAMILDGPREMHLYTCDALVKREYENSALLDKCCAIGFSNSKNEQRELLISASYDYPCALNVSCDETANESTIENLRAKRLI